MKRRSVGIYLVATTTIATSFCATPAFAQYAAARPTPQNAVGSPPAGYQQPARPTAQPTYTAYRPQQTQYGVQTSTQYPQATYPSYQQSAAGYPTSTPAAVAANQQMAAPYGQYPAYPRVAQGPAETLPTPAQTEPIPAPAAPLDSSQTNDAAMPYSSYGTPAPTAADYGYSQPGYGNGTAGCANGSTVYSGGTTECYGNYSSGSYPDYGVSGYCDDSCGGTQWFGGAYFLWMERDNATPVKLTVEVDHAAVVEPYYPPATATVVSTHQTDFDYRAGVEVRFGSTFSIGSDCDTSGSCGTGYAGCNTCGPAMAPQMYAWEAAWWGIDDDAQCSTYLDEVPTVADDIRIYGMKNFVGVEYDRDAGGVYAYRPVNDYYNYALPIQDPPGAAPDGYIVVLAQRVRTNFDAQNLELNIVRFPICDMGCAAGSCGSYDACGCEPQYCSTFSMYGSCGARYFRVDDEFLYATEFGSYTGGVIDQGAYNGFSYDNSNELFYNVDVENHLVGAQVGWSMNYCVACRWNFFCNSNFGLYNNHINHYQRLWSGGDGTVRFVQTGETMSVRSNKDDIAFLGELRLGGSYDISCNWRAVAAYRAVAVAGLATSTDQIPDEFTNSEYVAIIDSDNSMIIHGLQLGAECRY